MCVRAVCSFSHVQLFATPWTVAHKALLFRRFPRQEYWSGLPCPPPGELPNPGIEPTFPAASALQMGSLLLVSMVAQLVKNPPASARELRALGFIPGLGRSPGEGHGNPLQYSCLENPMDRGAWRATVHEVTKSRDTMKQLSMHTHTLIRDSIQCLPLSD